MDADDRLRLDYDQTTQLLRALMDVRFKLLGFVPVGQHRGLGLVYGAAISGWSYLVAWGALKALEVDDARKLGGAIGALAGIVVLAEVERIDWRPDRTPQSQPEQRAPSTPA